MYFVCRVKYQGSCVGLPQKIKLQIWKKENCLSLWFVFCVCKRIRLSSNFRLCIISWELRDKQSLKKEYRHAYVETFLKSFTANVILLTNLISLLCFSAGFGFPSPWSCCATSCFHVHGHITAGPTTHTSSARLWWCTMRLVWLKSVRRLQNHASNMLLFANARSIYWP